MERGRRSRGEREEGTGEREKKGGREKGGGGKPEEGDSEAGGKISWVTKFS